ncbi:c-type cytochrome [Roseibium sp.]|uniref:c-type cytochrome n=1 Tax=Roseibium sp. TaxID=1936156 RepID=UPI003B521A4C
MTWTHVSVITLAIGGGLAFAAVSGYGPGWMGSSDRAILKPENLEIVSAGEQIYRDNCASCHGQNLEGEANWGVSNPDGTMPAPPHNETGHTWHHGSQLLFDLTKHGLDEVAGGDGYSTNMPAFKDVLTDQEIIAVLSFIKSTWPKEIQVRHDELDAALARGG